MIERINKRKVAGFALACNEKGERMTKFMIRSAFDRAQLAAAAKYPRMAKGIDAFQFRDLRTKAGADKEKKTGWMQLKRIRTFHLGNDGALRSAPLG